MGQPARADDHRSANVELNQALQDAVNLSYGDWSLTTAAAQLRAAGLEVVDEREAVSPGFFADIGAVVMYLQIASWQLEGFDIATYRERLLALYRRIQGTGGLTTSIHRFLVTARRPKA